MKTIKITAHAIVNISGHGEKFQGDVLTVSDDTAEHLVSGIQVAEYLDQPADLSAAQAVIDPVAADPETAADQPADLSAAQAVIDPVAADPETATDQPAAGKKPRA